MTTPDNPSAHDGPAGAMAWVAAIVAAQLQFVEDLPRYIATVCVPRRRAAAWWARRAMLRRTGRSELPPAAHAGLIALAVLLAVLLALVAAIAPLQAVAIQLPGMGTEAATFARLIDAG